MYWEPLAEPQRNLQALLDGPPVKKLLFMTDAARISSAVLPHWQVRRVARQNVCTAVRSLQHGLDAQQSA